MIGISPNCNFMPGVAIADIGDVERMAQIYYDAHDPSRGLNVLSADYKSAAGQMRTKTLQDYFNNNHCDILMANSLKAPKTPQGYLVNIDHGGWWQLKECFTAPNEEKAGTRLIHTLLNAAYAKKELQFITVRPMRRRDDKGAVNYRADGFYGRFGFVPDDHRHLILNLR